MATQIQLRRDTAANWSSANPVLASGEVGFETDQNQFKIGDGSTDYANLSYAGGGSAEIGNTLSNVNTITSEVGQNIAITADGGQLILGTDDADHATFKRNIDTTALMQIGYVHQTQPGITNSGFGFGSPVNVDIDDGPSVIWTDTDTELGQVNNLPDGGHGTMVYPSNGGGANVLKYIEANTNIKFGSAGSPFDGTYGGSPNEYNPSNASVLVFNFVGYDGNAYVTAWSSTET